MHVSIDDHKFTWHFVSVLKQKYCGKIEQTTDSMLNVAAAGF